MCTAPGKVWLSVSTVNPFERLVTLYSAALSVVSMDLSLYAETVGEWLMCVFAYLVDIGGHRIELSHLVGVCVLVDSVENSGDHSGVGAESSFLVGVSGEKSTYGCGV